MDILSEVTTPDQLERQENGMYWCRVNGRVVEMSAEDYYFIALGYPQRMMQSSHLSGAWEEQDTAGAVKGQEVLPSNSKFSVSPKQLSGY